MRIESEGRERAGLMRLRIAVRRIRAALRAWIAPKVPVGGVAFIDLRKRDERSRVDAVSILRKALAEVDQRGRGEVIRRSIRFVIACDDSSMEGFQDPILRSVWVPFRLPVGPLPEKLLALSLVGTAAKFDLIHTRLRERGKSASHEEMRKAVHIAQAELAMEFPDPDVWLPWIEPMARPGSS